METDKTDIRDAGVTGFTGDEFRERHCRYQPLVDLRYSRTSPPTGLLTVAGSWFGMDDERACCPVFDVAESGPTVRSIQTRSQHRPAGYATLSAIVSDPSEDS